MLLVDRPAIMQGKPVLLLAQVQLIHSKHVMWLEQAYPPPKRQTTNSSRTAALSDFATQHRMVRKRRRDLAPLVGDPFAGQTSPSALPALACSPPPPTPLQLGTSIQTHSAQHPLQHTSAASTASSKQQTKSSATGKQTIRQRSRAPRARTSTAEPRSALSSFDADEESEEDESQVPMQRKTVRMSRLPGGMVVNGKASPGFVTLRSGNRIACPKCEGSGWVGGGTRGMPCDVCSIQKAGEMLDLAAQLDEEGEDDWRRPAVSQDTRRKSSTTQGGRQKKCSLCGELGHNKATCPQNPEAKPAEAPPPKAQKPKQRSDTDRKRFKGVSWNKATHKWRAQIWNNIKNTVEQKGYFNDEVEAARAHDVALLELRGPDAVTNFPPEDYDFDLRAWHRARQQERDEREEVAVEPAPEETEHSSTPVESEPAIPQRMAIPSVFPLPRDQATAQALAVAAIQKAHAAGIRKQAVEFYLPGGGEGWPGGVRQQYAAAQALLEGTIRDVKRLPALQGRMEAHWLDEMERVGMWRSEAMAAVVFPNAETLSELRSLEASQQRLLLMFNPQWQTTGQLLSDFGFGRGAREAEAFVSSFQDVYVMRQLRIDGDNVVLFKCYPGRWQVHYQWQNGRGDLLVARQDKRPTYSDLLSILRQVPGSQVSRSPSWVDKVKPFFMGMTSRDSLLMQKSSDEDSGGLFEREPQSGDVMQTNDAQQILGGQMVDLGGSGTTQKRTGESRKSERSLGERVGMHREETTPRTQRNPSTALDMEILDDMPSLGAKQRKSRTARPAKAPQKDSDTETDDDLELFSSRQASRRANGSTASNSSKAKTTGSKQASPLGRFDQLDIITGLPVRDVRMEPLAAFAAWQQRARQMLGQGSDSSRPDSQQGEARDDSSQ